MNIYILVACHNRKVVTQQFLESIFSQSYRNFEVVLVDAGSQDGTYEMVQEKFNKVKLIKGKYNWWWSRSMNEGLRYIMSVADNNSKILFINDDTTFGEDYLNKLSDLSNQLGDKYCIGTLLQNSNGSVCDPGLTINWNQYIFNKIKYNDRLSGVHPDTLSGRGTLFPASLIKEIGYLDEKNFPQNLADYDFFIRAKREQFLLFVTYNVVTYNYSQKNDVRQAGFIWKIFNKKSTSNTLHHLRFIKKHSPHKIRTTLSYFQKLFLKIIKIFKAKSI